jgi:hypothetical protein
MNLEKLKQILIDNKIFIKDKTKNFLCKCCYCNDHPDPKKQGHLYVSKNASIPVCHCWFCGIAVPIPKLIQDLTGNKDISKEVISDEELQEGQKKQKKYTSKKRFEELKIPQIDFGNFQNKKLYVRKRTNNQIDLEKIPGLIFNFLDFFRINNIDIVGENKEISNREMDLLQSNFVGLLGEHHTFLYCRNIDPNATFKFRKIPLQIDTLHLLEYWAIKVEDPTRNTVVLSEGNYNILGEYISDSLKIKDNVRIYASGNSFSYSALLKSVCFDQCLYKTNVIILSDDDKKSYHYKKFLDENKHIIKTCKIYINKNGKDFGLFPQVASQIL